MESKDIKKAGLKITLPRVKILEVLESGIQRHMSAEDVYKELLNTGSEIGLATVYRVLTQFEAAGLVNRHHFEGGLSVFEMNDGHHHDHLMCIKCGKIFEFMDETIEKKQKEIAENLGFSISDHCLYLYGVCQKENCPNLANT
jgi:Fur family ferric uptake transcriptional regulator